MPGYGAQGGKGADLLPFFNEDGLGAITHIALCLSKQNWFRNYVKVLKCYRWNADTQDFDVEDAIQDMIFADFPVS